MIRATAVTFDWKTEIGNSERAFNFTVLTLPPWYTSHNIGVQLSCSPFLITQKKEAVAWHPPLLRFDIWIIS